MKNILISLFLLLFLSSFSFAGTTHITDCQELPVADQIYILDNNISVNGSCFNITGTNITLQCGGYVIQGNNSGNGINYINKTRLYVMDCTFEYFDIGAYVQSSNISHFQDSVFRYNNIGIFENKSKINTYLRVSSHHNDADGINIYNGYDDIMTQSAFNSNGDHGAYFNNVTYSEFSYSDFTGNYDGMAIISCNHNDFINDTFYYNDNDGFISSAETDDDFINCSFVGNAWTGLEITGGTSGHINTINNAYIYNNSYNGIYQDGYALILNSQISLNDFNGIENVGLNVNITNCSINDNGEYGIYAFNGIGIVKDNFIGNNIAGGLYIDTIFKQGSVYNNKFNNSVNFKDTQSELPSCSQNLHLYTSLTCNTSNIIGGICMGGNAYYNPTGAGKGYSDNATKCEGNSSGICINPIIEHWQCGGYWDYDFTIDAYPLADLMGSSEYINVIITSPLNNTSYGNPSINLNFSFTSSFSNATCLYYLDGWVSNFTVLGILNNNTNYSLPLNFSNGVHNISLACTNDAIYDWAYVVNFTVSPYVHLINFTSPVSGMTYTAQPYITFRVNSSFNSVECLGSVNSYNLYTWPPFMMNNTMLYNRSFAEFQNLTEGNYTVTMNCSNGTYNDWDTKGVFYINFSYINYTGAYLNIINFSSPANDTNYTSQPYVTFKVNTSFSNVSCLGYVNGNNLYLWPPFNLSNNTYYNQSFASFQNFTNGNYNLTMECWKGIMLNSSTRYNFTINLPYNASNEIVNVIEASKLLISTADMIKFILGLICIGFFSYMGFQFAGSAGALICMVVVCIILSLVDPPFIPSWMTILGIIGGVLGIIYTAKNDGV